MIGEDKARVYSVGSSESTEELVKYLNSLNLTDEQRIKLEEWVYRTDDKENEYFKNLNRLNNEIDRLRQKLKLIESLSNQVNIHSKIDTPLPPPMLAIPSGISSEDEDRNIKKG